MKRILSAVLCAVLLLALCPAALAVDSDYAAYYLTEYQIQSGDTLTSICESRGIKYAEYATAIKNVNGLTNPNALVAGRKLWLPTRTLGEADRYYTVYRHVLVKGDTIASLCTTYGTTLKAVEAMTKSLNGVTNLTSFMAGTSISFPVPGGSLATAAPATPTTTTTTTTTGTTTAAQTSVKAQTGDYVAFYLTSYTCNPGDTLTAICKSRGVTYANYKGLILSLNKLASETSLIAGRSYWMPTASLDGSTVYYTVYRHLLISGDTMYALCNAYGINMQKYTDLILKLNNKKNLTSFMAGTAVYLPVYCANGTAGTGTAAVPGTGTGLDESTAGVGGGKVTTQTGVDANGNPVTVTTTTSTTVTELPGLFDATVSANYYLVPYTVKSGDSLIGICNDLGSSFSRNKNILVAANGLQSYNVSVGSTIYVPVPTANGAARYYSVSVKTIQFGDTVYGYYCNANADFSVNYKMLTDLNGAINFNNLPVGGKLAIPVLVG